MRGNAGAGECGDGSPVDCIRPAHRFNPASEGFEVGANAVVAAPTRS